MNAQALRAAWTALIEGLHHAERTLREHYKLLSLDGCGLAGKPFATGAAGVAWKTLLDTAPADGHAAATYFATELVRVTDCRNDARTQFTRFG